MQPSTGNRSDDQLRETPVSRTYLIVGSLISVAASLLLAIIAFGIVLIFAGSPTEGGYCSDSGIGRFEAQTPEKVAAYIDEGWSGIPPKHRCRVYLTAATDDNPPLSGEELLRRDPSSSRLLAEGTYPGAQEYIWIVAAFLLPLLAWGLLLVTGRFVRRKP